HAELFGHSRGRCTVDVVAVRIRDRLQQFGRDVAETRTPAATLDKSPGRCCRAAFAQADAKDRLVRVGGLIDVNGQRRYQIDYETVDLDSAQIGLSQPATVAAGGERQNYALRSAVADHYTAEHLGFSGPVGELEIHPFRH